jgi:RNA-directed DNA polymerase
MTTAQAVGAVSREAAAWYAINWQAIHRNVRRLQVRIVQATKDSRRGRVRALQRLLTHSYSGKVLAVRRVTENNGKATPGVDQEIWDTPEQKTRAVHALKRRGYRSQPLRRVYIPKSDGKTMRPFGIPTMIDRGQQALHLLALDPVVETTADRNSYGFRQRRSCADAIGQCFLALRSAKAQWVLEGDIKSCFDNISHDWLLAHVLNGLSHSPKVVEIRVHGKTRPSRINGWDSPRRNHLSRARHLRAGRTGTAPAGKIPRR